MATFNLGNASPTGDVKHIDLKHPSIQIRPVALDTPSLTPATTPEETSPAEDGTMAGKKIFSLERPDDKARELAAKLTLEEQVRFSTFLYESPTERAWSPAVQNARSDDLSSNTRLSWSSNGDWLRNPGGHERISYPAH